MPDTHPARAPRLPALDRLAAFDAAARQLSFTRAAAERFVTQSAISRQVAALEDELGAALFVRRHRALELTPAGERLHAAVTQALAGVREAVAAIRAPARREVLALTTTPGLASLWLIPRLQGFIAEHPGIDVRIDATHDMRALAGEGFDLAIRYVRWREGAAGGSVPGAAAGEPLFAETVQPVCAPALLKGPRPLRTLADIAHHTLLMVAIPTPTVAGMPIDWAAWLRAVGAGPLEAASTLTFTNYDTAVAAAVEGQGLVLGRRPLVDRLLAQRRLVAPFKGLAASQRGYVLVVEPNAAARPAVQALVGWLRAQARGGG